MANIFSTISIVCFIFAGISFIGAIILFFALNTKAAYSELKGKPQRERIIKNRKDKEELIFETPTHKLEVENDAETVILCSKGERGNCDELRTKNV